MKKINIFSLVLCCIVFSACTKTDVDNVPKQSVQNEAIVRDANGDIISLCFTLDDPADSRIGIVRDEEQIKDSFYWRATDVIQMCGVGSDGTFTGNNYAFVLASEESVTARTGRFTIDGSSAMPAGTYIAWCGGGTDNIEITLPAAGDTHIKVNPKAGLPYQGLQLNKSGEGDAQLQDAMVFTSAPQDFDNETSDAPAIVLTTPMSVIEYQVYPADANLGLGSVCGVPMDSPDYMSYPGVLLTATDDSDADNEIFAASLHFSADGQLDEDECTWSAELPLNVTRTDGEGSDAYYNDLDDKSASKPLTLRTMVVQKSDFRTAPNGKYTIGISLARAGVTGDPNNVSACNIEKTPSDKSLLVCNPGRIRPVSLALDASQLTFNIASEADLNDAVARFGTRFGIYNITADFTVAGAWTPIGTSGSKFTGIVLGNGHTITWQPNASIFGQSDCGVVQDLTVNGAAISSASSGTGLFFTAADGVTIENCVIKNSTITSTATITGGFIGQANHAGAEPGIKTITLKKCLAENLTMSSTMNNLGALIGYVNYTGDVTITGCKAVSCAVTHTSSTSGVHVGGLIGQVGRANKCTISQCSLEGVTVTSRFSNVAVAGAGGIVGSVPSSFVGELLIEKCSTDANSFIHAVSPANGFTLAGGIVSSAGGGSSKYDENSINIIIRNCVNRATVTNHDPDTGLASPGHGNSILGGICANGGLKTLIIGCKNEGLISASGTTVNGWKIGGIVGNNYGKVASCYNTGTIEGDNTIAGSNGGTGGIVGRNSMSLNDETGYGYISGCYNTGLIVNAYGGADDKNYSVYGGILGRNLTSGVVESCFWIRHADQSAPPNAIVGSAVATTTENYCAVGPLTEDNWPGSGTMTLGWNQAPSWWDLDTWSSPWSIPAFNTSGDYPAFLY